jgi:hypothetical protein
MHQRRAKLRADAGAIDQSTKTFAKRISYTRRLDVFLEVSTKRKVSGDITARTIARAQTILPDGIGDDVSLVPNAVAVLLVVGDDGRAGVVLAVGSQSCRLTRCARFFFMCL